MALKGPQQSFEKLVSAEWRTKSGKPSLKTGERYLPEKAIKSLTSAEYSATTRAKRQGTKSGKQFVRQPKSIAKRLHSFAEEHNIKLLREDVPDWELRLDILKHEIGKEICGQH